MSPATQALLCDESEKLFASTSPRGIDREKVLEGGVKNGDRVHTQASSENPTKSEGTILPRARPAAEDYCGTALRCSDDEFMMLFDVISMSK